MVNFVFLEKCLEIVSLLYFLYNFSRKYSIILLLNINILLTEQISPSDCLYFWRLHVYITVVCVPGCDFVSFEINLIFLIKQCF